MCVDWRVTVMTQFGLHSMLFDATTNLISGQQYRPHTLVSIRFASLLKVDKFSLVCKLMSSICGLIFANVM